MINDFKCSENNFIGSGVYHSDLTHANISHACLGLLYFQKWNIRDIAKALLYFHLFTYPPTTILVGVNPSLKLHPSIRLYIASIRIYSVVLCVLKCKQII